MVKDLKRTYHVGPNSKLNDAREGLRDYIAEEETTSGLIEDLQTTKSIGYHINLTTNATLSLFI